jgi:hypothetical protein
MICFAVTIVSHQKEKKSLRRMKTAPHKYRKGAILAPGAVKLLRQGKKHKLLMRIKRVCRLCLQAAPDESW